MRKKILIIGNNQENYHVGSMFIRAAQELKLLWKVKDNNLITYAPSMKYILGKLFFKFNNKIPLGWWSFNQRIVELINEFKPDLILVTGIFPLLTEVFIASRKINAIIVNFLTDDPYAKELYCSRFIKNLKKYDLVISTKRRVIPDLITHGVSQPIFIPYAYDPFWHRLPDPVSESQKERFIADISFVGTGAYERVPILEMLSSIENLNLKLYGNDWEKIFVKGWKKSPAVFNNEFRLAMYFSKISVCLLRKRSRDDSTQRTFEIAPCGGCGIYEDTPEHREILAGYPEYGFFSSSKDLVDKCKWLLEHPTEREQMKQLGIQLVATERNTYTGRLKTILNLINS